MFSKVYKLQRYFIQPYIQQRMGGHDRKIKLKKFEFQNILVKGFQEWWQIKLCDRIEYQQQQEQED